MLRAPVLRPLLASARCSRRAGTAGRLRRFCSDDTGGTVASQPSLPMPKAVRLPSIGDSSSAIVLKYLKAPGDALQKDDDLVEVDYGAFVVCIGGEEGVLGAFTQPVGAKVTEGDELAVVLKDARSYEAWQREHSVQEDVFTRFAADKDAMTRGEFSDAIKALLPEGGDVTREQIDSLMGKLDLDEDNKVGREEFRRAVRNMLGQA